MGLLSNFNTAKALVLETVAIYKLQPRICLWLMILVSWLLLEEMAVRATSIENSTLQTNTQGIGNAGNIVLNISDRTIFNPGGAILTQVGVGGTGTGGNIEINTGDLSFTGVSVNDRTSLLADSRGIRDTGNITLNFDILTITGGSNINSLTENDSNGGAIAITAKNINLATGGKIITGTDSRGDAARRCRQYYSRCEYTNYYRRC